MENRIIKAAREVFIDKGFAETSMSEIATVVGINRPALHYYFRTKDKMFQAVFGDIVQSIVPAVFDNLMHRELPLSERVERIVDAYISLFTENPRLPMFMMRELNRDPELLINTIRSLNVIDTMKEAFTSLQEEMNEGKLKNIPLQFLFYNMYGMLIIPFLTKDAVQKLYTQSEEEFLTYIAIWKNVVVSQICNLLEVQ
ncbi:MAG: TetR/AcrR family transcriptional regulator [Bacteroidaceae bacterium]|nr:TetR/AcrR family transcriptional regulator [Bacteroidaceae bacterium]